MIPGTPAERATDASVEGEHIRGTVSPLEDWRTVVAQRAVFQSLASMGLPAFTIHSIVRYSGRAMKDVKNVKIRTYGPIGVSYTRRVKLSKALKARFGKHECLVLTMTIAWLGSGAFLAIHV